LKEICRKRLFFRNLIKHGLFPLLFYFVVFCLLTYPLILKFFTHFFADGGDGLQNVWNLWWVSLAVRRPDLYPSLWQTNMVHWPFGVTLYGQTLNPFNGFLAVFLLRFLSLTATYNTITIFAFVMGGMTMYWLSHYLTKSFWGSIIAGFIFTFSSYHFMHAEGHLQLVSLEWIPLFVLCWYSLVTKPRTITAVGAAIVLWMVILCDYYYFFYCFLTAILIVLWYAVTNKNIWFIFKKKQFLPMATFAVVVVLLIGPIIGSLLISNYRDPLIGPHDPVIYSLDLLALFIPGGHWLFNQWTKFYWSKLPGNINESSVYLGVSVYVLLGYVWIKRKTLEFVDKQQIHLWFMTAGFFFVLALGPAFHIAGKVIWDKAMPYTLLVYVLPFLKLSGVPIRMMVMVILGASVLSAIGLRELFRQFPQKKIFTLVLLGILLFETLPRPLPATRVEVPEYVMAQAGLPNDGGVVDLVTNNKILSLYFQTINQKPIVFGYVSRLPTSVNQREEELRNAIKNHDYGKLWDTYHIRYVITHDTIQEQDVQPYISIKTVYDKNNIRIYRIGCECEGLK
jgi:hypothetical protein